MPRRQVSDDVAIGLGSRTAPFAVGHKAAIIRQAYDQGIQPFRSCRSSSFFLTYRAQETINP